MICEIGPIDDFTRHSRKTIDFWSGSFIFSYLMAEVARKIEDNGGEIFLPYFKDNPLYSKEGTVTCGSVPDQIYVLLNDHNRGEIEEALKGVISERLNDVVGRIDSKRERKKITGPIDPCEIIDFFNFFYIIHEIKSHYPSHEEFIEAERRIRMRYAIRPFEQLKDQESIPKWAKCSLCGDRKGVYFEPVDKDEVDYPYKKENICSVCILKRFLPAVVEEIVTNIDKKPRYQSTSDIALSPQKEECPKEIKLRWLDRHFYSIVYMDGDNMGEILKDSFSCIGDISKRLSEFSNKVSGIVDKNHGQLIFAGGEDINFIIHPEYLLDCIDKLNSCYKNTMSIFGSEKFTLSAGAVVCYHKYPLSEAIRRAQKMLKENAKKHPNKDATAISLIKGHKEAINLTISNARVQTLKELKECLLQADISRTTPYRIQKEIEILNRLTDSSQRRNYLRTIIAGTRGLERTEKK